MFYFLGRGTARLKDACVHRALHYVSRVMVTNLFLVDIHFSER